jgi:conjugal transfer pilus assembly protein TraK
MWFESKRWRSLSLLAAALSSPVFATQIVEQSDKQPVQVNVSAREANRLAVEGRRIASVVPAQPGLVSAKKDETQGVMYFTLTGEQTGTVTLFVTDELGINYKIVLVPRPIGAEEIILRPPAEKLVAKKGADGKATSYQRRAKDLIVVMADEEAAAAANVERVKVNKEIPLWQEARLVLVARFNDTDIVGEKYLLTNVSGAPMVLVEQELYRRGVRAISIKNQTLGPGEATDIYIVRERKENEQ